MDQHEIGVRVPSGAPHSTSQSPGDTRLACLFPECSSLWAERQRLLDAVLEFEDQHDGGAVVESAGRVAAQELDRIGGSNAPP